MRLALPQPFEDLGHTADVGVRVEGETCEEALARLVLAFAQLASGGGAVRGEREERVAVTGGPDLAGTAVALLRELLYLLATEDEVPAACEILRVDTGGAEALVLFGRRDPEAQEGADLKAVTWHAARLERVGRRWVGQLVFDL